MGPKLDTAIATTSGTTKDFSPPSWAKKITVFLGGVSHDGTEELIVQLGDSGGVETTGYSGDTSNAAGSTITPMSSGFLCVSGGAASQTVTGTVVLHLIDASTNTWIATINTTAVGSNVFKGSGSKALSGSLTTVRLTTTNTPDDFDAGSVNCIYE